MKAIKCELCGSSDVIKQGDFYVCQSCGTKYEPEAARRLIVGIDSTKKMANLYQRARKSLEVEDLEHAAEYYKEILDENPDDWEAYFYSYLGEFPSFTNAQAGNVATKLGNTIPAAYDMAISSSNATEAADHMQTITTKTVDRISYIARTGASLLRQYEGGNILTPAGKVHHDMYNGMRPVVVNTIIGCISALDSLEAKIQEIADSDIDIDEGVCTDCLLYVCRARFTIANITYTPALGATEKLIKAEFIERYAKKVKDLNPEIKELQARLDALDKRRESLPGMSDKKALEEQLATLKKEKESLGLFARKEKKAKQAQIDDVQAQIDRLMTSLSKPLMEIDAQRTEIKKRIDEINSEFK